MRNAVKIFICLFMLFMGTLSVSEVAHADKATYGVYKGIVYTDYDMPEGEVKVVNYKGKKKKITIPSKIRGRKVTKVTRFEKSKNLETMHIPASVEEISVSEAPALTKVTISKNNKHNIVKGDFILNKRKYEGYSDEIENEPGTVIYSCVGGIKNAKIPNYVKRIAVGAFYGSQVETVTFGDNVEYVESSAFAECRELTEVSLGASLKNIEGLAFEWCGSIKVTLNNTENAPTIEELTFDNSVKGTDFYLKNETVAEQLKANLYEAGMEYFRIYVEEELYYTNLYEEDGIFYQVKNGEAVITSVSKTEKVLTIPDKLGGKPIPSFVQCICFWFTVPEKTGGYPVTSVGMSAFRNTECEEIHLPDTVKSIESFAFARNAFVKKIVLAKGVETINSYAFEECTALKSIEIPDSVTTMDDYAFNKCTALESVTLSENLQEISYHLFADCTALKDIVIPKKVSNIAEWAFSGCESLISIEINSDSLELERGVFYECFSLKEINLPSNLKKIPNNAFGYCSSLEEIEIPDSVTEIEDYAFGFCEKIKEVKLPKELEIFYGDSFGGCYGLEKYEIDEGNIYFLVKDGILYDKGETRIISYPPGKKDKKYQSASSIQVVENYAFKYNQYLEDVVVYAKEIGYGAFSNMKNLTAFTWKGQGKTLKSNAFGESRKLKTVILPNSLKELEGHVFAKTAVKTLKIPDSLNRIDDYTFYRSHIKTFILGKNKNFKVKNGRLKEIE